MPVAIFLLPVNAESASEREVSNSSHDLLAKSVEGGVRWWCCWWQSSYHLLLQAKTLTQLRLCRVLAHYCRARRLLRAMGNCSFAVLRRLVGHFFSSLFSLLDILSESVVGSDHIAWGEGTVVAVAERRSQSIYRQFTKLRWGYCWFVERSVRYDGSDRGRRPVTATAIDRRYCPA